MPRTRNPDGTPAKPQKATKPPSAFWSGAKWLMGGAALAIVGYESLRIYKRVRGPERKPDEPQLAPPGFGPSPMSSMPNMIPMPMPWPMPWQQQQQQGRSTPQIVVIERDGKRRSKKGPHQAEIATSPLGEDDIRGLEAMLDRMQDQGG